ncbi:hypothetical protein Tco_0853612 [Tanacetum coccineum]
MYHIGKFIVQRIEKKIQLCCDGTVISAEGESFCSSDAGSDLLYLTPFVVGEQRPECHLAKTSQNLLLISSNFFCDEWINYQFCSLVIDTISL